MIICNDKDKLNEVNNWSLDNIRILMDFDNTITSSYSDSSWGILSKGDFLGEEYNIKMKEQYDYYRPFEIDEELDFDKKYRLMDEWWRGHIDYLIKYGLTEDMIDSVIDKCDVMFFRDGVVDFFKNMYDNGVPVIIISAGIGNFIVKFLEKNKCYFDNMYVLSNFIKFEKGKAVGVCGDVIHSQNKSEVSLPSYVKDKIVNRNNVILFGDSISDIKMVRDDERECALKIGFLEEKVFENRKYFEDNFDIVGIDNVSYNDLFEFINILKR